MSDYIWAMYYYWYGRKNPNLYIDENGDVWELTTE